MEKNEVSPSLKIKNREHKNAVYSFRSYSRKYIGDRGGFITRNSISIFLFEKKNSASSRKMDH